MKHLIGIDIGGTKISVSIGAAKGRVLGKILIPTQTGRLGARASAKAILLHAEQLLRKSKVKIESVKGIGVGIPGPVHPEKELIEKSPNLPGWEHFPLRQILKKHFKVPVHLENDANAAAVGEKFFGAGKRVKDFVYITVSTGVGAGIISNGKLVRGNSGCAGELGHTTIVVGGERCGCGKRGCVEAYASGTAIAKFASREIRNGCKSTILKFCKIQSDVTGTAVSDAADAGDSLAIRIRKQAGDYLGVGIGNLINVLNPSEIILGGGVLENPNHFWAPMMKAIKREAWPFAFKSCKIVRTRLGKQVGDLGAMAVVLERSEH